MSGSARASRAVNERRPPSGEHSLAGLFRRRSGAYGQRMTDPGFEAELAEHAHDHRHHDVSGGWLRAATFGAMDGLVTTIALIAGVGGGGADRQLIILTGLAGVVAGAFSMALGEFASVGTQNDALDREVRVEKRELERHPRAEQAELEAMYRDLGLTEQTAAAVAREVHADPELALRAHINRELGVTLGRGTVAVDGGAVVVRRVRGRWAGAAGVVPAGRVVAVARSGDRWRGPARGRGADVEVHVAHVVGRRAASADVRRHRGGCHLPGGNVDRRQCGVTLILRQ